MPLTNQDYANIKVMVAQHMYTTQHWFPGHAPAGTSITYHQIPENSEHAITYRINFTCAGAFDPSDTIEFVGENHYKTSTGAEFDAYIE